MANNETPLASQIAAEVRAVAAFQMKDKHALAEFLKIDLRTARKLWAGEKGYSLDQIAAIADWLGVDHRSLTDGVYAASGLAVPA